MRAIIQKAGLDIENQVDFCITGLEALEQVKDAYLNSMSYSVIFTDFSMPIMDGIDATRKIREFLTNEMAIPLENQPTIIGVTGHINSQFAILGERAGMNEVVPKPIYLSSMVQILTKLGMKQ